MSAELIGWLSLKHQLSIFFETVSKLDIKRKQGFNLTMIKDFSILRNMRKSVKQLRDTKEKIRPNGV